MEPPSPTPPNDGPSLAAALNDDEIASDEERGRDDDDAASAERRHVVGIEVLDEPIRVAPPQRHHASWDAWLAYKESYEATTMQVLAVLETMNVSQRNARRLATKGAQRAALYGRPFELIPESWGVFQRVYVCTHASKPKRRGKGLRHRPVRFTACPFRFVVQVVRRNDGAWGLEVKHGVYRHNHRIDEAIYKTYPSSRGIKSEATAAAVESMLQNGETSARIYDFLVENGENVRRSDVSNMVCAFKAKATVPRINNRAANGSSENAVTRSVEASQVSSDGSVNCINATTVPGVNDNAPLGPSGLQTAENVNNEDFNTENAVREEPTIPTSTSSNSRHVSNGEERPCLAAAAERSRRAQELGQTLLSDLMGMSDEEEFDASIDFLNSITKLIRVWKRQKTR